MFVEFWLWMVLGYFLDIYYFTLIKASGEVTIYFTLKYLFKILKIMK